MGGGGQTKEAAENQRRANQYYDPYINTGGARSDETYNYGKGAVGDAADFYRRVLAGEVGPGGGGGGGYQLTPEDLKGLGEDVYLPWKTTGGWSDTDRTDFRGRAIGEAQAPYAQAMRQAAIGQRVQGGWGSGVDTTKLALLRGAESGRTSALLGADTEMEKQIRENILKATAGEAGITEKKIAARRAAAAAAAGSSRAQFEAQEAAARGLLGSVDVMNTAGLPYYGAQGAGIGGWGGLSANLGQQRNPSFLQQMGGIIGGLGSLGSGIGSAASAWGSIGKKKGATE